MTKRLIWIDWMKVLAMYCIVWGHFFSSGHEFLYVFNVPVFFVISGFLVKRENSNVFWYKIFHNLFLPMLLISSINFIFNTAVACLKGTFVAGEILSFPFLILAGSWYELGGMWFVYTLLILKILFQFTPIKKTYLGITFILLNILLFYLYKNNYQVFGINLLRHPNAMLNICTAYPFFIFGYLMQSKRDFLETLNFSALYFMTALFICLCVVIACGYFNDIVWMYLNEFGNNYLLFLLGGISGTAVLFLIAKKFEHITPYWLNILSEGTIIILGFQMVFIRIIIKIFPTRSCSDMLFSFIIMIIFIPIISICKRRFPYLLGKR